MSDTRGIKVSVNDATPEEFAAITAAVDVLWPEPSVEEDVRDTAQTVWKFANRWWSGSRLGASARKKPKGTGFFSS
jgi:hypothetical protein